MSLLRLRLSTFAPLSCDDAPGRPKCLFRHRLFSIPSRHLIALLNSHSLFDTTFFFKDYEYYIFDIIIVIENFLIRVVKRKGNKIIK